MLADILHWLTANPGALFSGVLLSGMVMMALSFGLGYDAGHGIGYWQGRDKQEDIDHDGQSPAIGGDLEDRP